MVLSEEERRLFLKAQEEKKRKKLERKLQKKALGANNRDESTWPKCLFWITKCNRFCSGERVPNSNYCINHSQIDNENSKGKRVPCPIDPSHTVYESNLKRHIKICNKVKIEKNRSTAPFFSSGLNSGNDTYSTEISVDKEAFERNLERKIRQTYSSLFPNGIPLGIPSGSKSAEDMQPFIDDKSRQGATQESLRHLYQQVSMVCNMQAKHMMERDPVYVEFGAGRGMLSLGIDYCLNHELHQDRDERVPKETKGKYLMIDMSPVRFKADRWLRHKGDQFLRITGNIRDVDLKRVPIFESEKNREVVCIAKHLCGVATDYTIRCILNSIISDSSSSYSLQAGACNGLCIATCCHHRCQWHSFVGKEYYKQLGFQENEWDFIRKLTSWTSVSEKNEHSNKEKEGTKSQNEDVLTFNTAQIEYIQMDKRLGRMCKRIIDYCRCEYIKEQVNHTLLAKKIPYSFQTELVYYCSEEDSPENCLLLGYMCSI